MKTTITVIVDTDMQNVIPAVLDHITASLGTLLIVNEASVAVSHRPSKEWYAKGIAETLDANELIGPMGMSCPHSNRSDCALFENKK